MRIYLEQQENGFTAKAAFPTLEKNEYGTRLTKEVTFVMHNIDEMAGVWAQIQNKQREAEIAIENEPKELKTK